MKISKIKHLKILTVIFILSLFTNKISPQSLVSLNLSCLNLLQNKNLPHPSQFIKDFPALTWNMNFDDAISIIKKSGLNPVSIIKTEIAWDGTFDNIFGRSTILLDEKTGVVNQMSLVLYGVNKLDQLFNNWKISFTKKYGKPTAKEDKSNAFSLIWKTKVKILVELRKLKDPDSPVININWVKE